MAEGEQAGVHSDECALKALIGEGIREYEWFQAVKATLPSWLYETIRDYVVAQFVNATTNPQWWEDEGRVKVLTALDLMQTLYVKLSEYEE